MALLKRCATEAFALKTRALVLSVMLANGACVSTALAQSRPANSALSVELRGICVDSTGAAITDVLVVLRAQRRQTISGVGGSFAFDSVDAGTYELIARRIGYATESFRVTVGDTNTFVRLQMRADVRNIRPIVTTAERTGLSGVVSDTSLRALEKIQISALGSGKAARTDASGAFFLPLKAGQYLLKIEADGFATQTKAVVISESAGTHIAVSMLPRSRSQNFAEANSLFDLSQRVMRSSPASTHYFVGEELARQGIHDLQDVAHRFASGRVTSECDVSIGGTANVKIPLSLLSAAEIEFLEVYLPTNTAGGGAASRGITSVSGNRNTIRTPTDQGRPAPVSWCGNMALIAWLKK